METHINTYKLTQGTKEYILTICSVGEKMRITCKSTLSVNNESFSRDFSLDELKNIDPIFNNANSPYEALDYMDRALKIQKVGVMEEGEIIKINIFSTKPASMPKIEVQTISTQDQYTQNTNINTTFDLNQATTYGGEYQESQAQYNYDNQENYNYSTENVQSTTETIDNAGLQISTGAEDFSGTNVVDTAQYTTSEYTTTNFAGTTTDTTFETTQNYDMNQYASQTNDYNNDYANTFQTTQTVGTTNQYIEPTQGFDSTPYITPAEGEYQTGNLGGINTFEQTTTTTTTTTDINTNDNRNEHQLINDKINALSGEVNAYKTKLEMMEREKHYSELTKLRAENEAMKQQLYELNNLRNDAAEARFLRSQLAELDPLRKKVAEMEVLRSQLSELHFLRAKAQELNALKPQLEELNNLRWQMAQMNSLSNQLNDLNALKLRMAELTGIKSQLGDLNNLKEQMGQINILKQQISDLAGLKENEIDADNLKKKINELESEKLQYENEIKSLREVQRRSQTLEMQKMSERTGSLGMDSRHLLFEDKPQQICVKGDIIHNTDELELLTRKINKSNLKLTLNLLYKATADSDKAAAFHAKCDEANSTIVLVETDKGKRFGGFTTCSWSGDCVDKKDEDSFVFSLDKMEIYKNIPGEDAIGCYPKFGPIFLGCQIRIYDNAFTKGGTTFEKGLNFNTTEDYELTDGDREFKIKEIEVYEVIPQ